MMGRRDGRSFVTGCWWLWCPVLPESKLAWGGLCLGKRKRVFGFVRKIIL
jgi:hypothetical protein